MNDYSNRKNQPFNRWIDKWMRWYQCKKKIQWTKRKHEKKVSTKIQTVKTNKFCNF